MKCPLRADPEGNFLNCYEDSCAWWVIDSDLSGSVTKGSCSILEVAVNGIVFSVEDDEEEGDI